MLLFRISSKQLGEAGKWLFVEIYIASLEFGSIIIFADRLYDLFGGVKVILFHVLLTCQFWQQGLKKVVCVKKVHKSRGVKKERYMFFILFN